MDTLGSMPESAPRAARRRALLVDDEVIFRSLAANAVADFGFEVEAVGDAESAREAFTWFEPDIVIVDLELGEGPTGIELVEYIRAHHASVPIMILSAYRSPHLIDSHAQPLARDIGYVVKSDVVDVEVLHQAIENTLASNPPAPSADGAFAITRNQAAVLRMIAEGMSNAAIAEERKCSARSLERLINRLYQALGIAGDAAINPRVTAARMYRESRIDAQ